MVAADVQQKDVVLAVITTSAALVGLLLVFLGLIVASYEGYDTEAQTRVHSKFRVQARWIVGGFAAGLLCLVACALWLLRQWQPFYAAAIFLFFVQLVLLAVASAVSTRGLVWG